MTEGPRREPGDTPSALGPILDAVERAMVAELDRAGPWDERLARCLDTLVALIVDRPAAARLCLVDVYAAGPGAVERVDAMVDRVGDRILAVLAESEHHRDLPDGVGRAVIGGLRTVIQTRVHAGDEAALAELSPHLIEWALGYRAPPVPLAPATPPPAPVAEPRGRPAEDRVLAAVVGAVAAGGSTRGHAAGVYGTVPGTGDDPDAGAAADGLLGMAAFGSSLGPPEDAFLAALDKAMERMLDATLPPYRDAPDWPRGVRDGLDSLFAYLSRRPELAHFVGAAVSTVGPEPLSRIDAGVRSFHALLTEGLRDRSAIPARTAEGISASVLALAYDQARRRGGDRLYEIAPAATFIALAPAIGVIEACTVVNERRGPALTSP